MDKCTLSPWTAQSSLLRFVPALRVKEHDWAKLTRVQRRSFPETHEMDVFYCRMDLSM